MEGTTVEKEYFTIGPAKENVPKNPI